MPWTLLSMLGGAVVGYGWGKIGADTRTVFLGTSVGLGVGIVLAVWRRNQGRFRLHTAKLKLPGITELEFELGEGQRQAGWRIFVELATRIVTQPMDPDKGLVRKALDSLYRVFEVVRTELKAMPPSPPTDKRTVEFLAARLLNVGIRPFLSYWHPRLLAWEGSNPSPEASWPHEEECRKQLEGKRSELVAYAIELGRLVGVSHPEQILGQHKVLGESGEQ